MHASKNNIKVLVNLQKSEENRKRYFQNHLLAQGFGQVDFDFKKRSPYKNGPPCDGYLVINIEDFIFFDLQYFLSRVSGNVSCLLEYSGNHGERLVELDENAVIRDYSIKDDSFHDGLVPTGIYFFKNYEDTKTRGLDEIISSGIDVQGVPVPRTNIPYDKALLKNALFLDRDGVVNVDTGYLHEVEDLVIYQEIIEIIKMVNQKGGLVFVITNQAGIARGKFSEDDLRNLNNHIDQKIKEQGAFVDGWYYCPFHPDKGQGQYKKYSFLRKPMPGMALLACQDHMIDLNNSFMVGDKVSDSLRHIGVETLLVQRNYDLSGSDCPVFESLDKLKMEIQV